MTLKSYLNEGTDYHFTGFGRCKNPPSVLILLNTFQSLTIKKAAVGNNKNIPQQLAVMSSKLGSCHVCSWHMCNSWHTQM